MSDLGFDYEFDASCPHSELEYHSKDELINELKKQYLESGVVLTIKNSSFRKKKIGDMETEIIIGGCLVLRCNKGGVYKTQLDGDSSSETNGCAFEIVCSARKGKWGVREVRGTHNHEISSDLSGHSTTSPNEVQKKVIIKKRIIPIFNQIGYLENQEIEVQEDGRYYCPGIGCQKSISRRRFKNLAKHCSEKHQITLTKVKRLKESTKRKYQNQEEMRKKEIVMKTECMDHNQLNQMTTEEWQKKITLENSDNLFHLNSMVDLHGVVVVQQFCNTMECDILNMCSRIAELLPDKYSKEITNGGIQMVNIPISNFNQSDINFKIGANVINSISDKLQQAFGLDYSLDGDLSILTTPNGAQKQFIHSDDILKERYNGIIVLSDNATPPIFLRKKYPDVKLYNFPTLDQEGRVLDDLLRSTIAQKYFFMMEPPGLVEPFMHYVSAQPLKKGDLILFEADMVYRGAQIFENETGVFFHLRKPTPSATVDLQFHAGQLGSLLFGTNPREKESYFNMIRMHDDSIPDTTVPLYDLLGDTVKKSYLEWLKKQPLA
ncbi:hypothetical protein BC833DRAFT_87011 [Globomyces pollinis-pini]|nr:hypothetical protein BC833DRAFT_87011 [Globomyces pollinis-pini]